MELLEGESLSDRLLRGPLPMAPALEIMLPVLSALTALHTRGLVHRDLKPSNMFLTPHAVKLLDFGLARQIARDAADTMSAVTLPAHSPALLAIWRRNRSRAIRLTREPICSPPESCFTSS